MGNSLSSKEAFTIDSLTRTECIEYLSSGYVRSECCSNKEIESFPTELIKICIGYIGKAHNLGLLSKKELESYQPNDQYFVKTLTGRTITLDLAPTYPIYLIKYLIQQQENIQYNTQRLICRGKQLEDEYTLADYNIRSKHTIHLVLKLRDSE